MDSELTPLGYVADWVDQAGAQDLARKHIVLVAHDNKKTDLLQWAQHNRALLARHSIYATGSTGRMIHESLDIPVRCFLSGPLGGDQQIGAYIAQGAIDLLVFFWDPLEPQPHDPDVKALLRIATLWNIAVASNRTTADMVISSRLFASTYRRTRPQLQGSASDA
ncbi:MAG: methylglyoxal synthase [Candidatus Nanopelagicales bacterium]|nr:methylglyoxal synthase [Candidatus Nanopelagicales bacterium]